MSDQAQAKAPEPQPEQPKESISKVARARSMSCNVESTTQITTDGKSQTRKYLVVKVDGQEISGVRADAIFELSKLMPERIARQIQNAYSELGRGDTVKRVVHEGETISI